MSKPVVFHAAANAPHTLADLVDITDAQFLPIPDFTPGAGPAAL